MDEWWKKSVAEKNYLVNKVPDLAPAAWELLFRLAAENGGLEMPDPEVSIDSYGAQRSEMAQRRVFGESLVAVGLAEIDDGLLYSTVEGESVVLAFEDAYEASHGAVNEAT